MLILAFSVQFTLVLFPIMHKHCSFQSTLISCQFPSTKIHWYHLSTYLSVKKSLSALCVSVQYKSRNSVYWPLDRKGQLRHIRFSLINNNWGNAPSGSMAVEQSSAKLSPRKLLLLYSGNSWFASRIEHRLNGGIRSPSVSPGKYRAIT
jgi:hypothetical protein